MVSSQVNSTVQITHNLIAYHKFSFGGKTGWRVSGHRMWATPHDFLCGVAPVGQLGMEGISAFYTGQVSLLSFKDSCHGNCGQSQAIT